MLTLLAGLFFVCWGARSLALSLPRVLAVSGKSWNEILHDAPASKAWMADLVIYEGRFSPALTAAGLLLVGGGLWWWWFTNRAPLADRLIDMETELHKVSWPTFPDAWQSTLVVSGFTALIVVIVFLYDMVIRGLMVLMPRFGGS